jgi:CD2 antigen cytoplasmic tail-binding protein 2
MIDHTRCYTPSAQTHDARFAVNTDRVAQLQFYQANTSHCSVPSDTTGGRNMSAGRQTMPAGGVRPKRTAEASERYTSPDSKKPRFDHRNPSTLAPDAPEEDAILELDEIGKAGMQTKRNAVKLDGYESDSSDDNFEARADEKAELAKQEGKLSDTKSSKNAGWNKAPQNNGKSKDEDEMDMFADVDEGTGGVGGTADGDDDEELRGEGKKAKKDVRFMEMDDIEGQVHKSKSGGHVRADFTLDPKGKSRAEDDASVESSSESGSDSERDRLDDENEDAEELGAGSKKKHAPKLDAFNMQQEGEEGRFDEAGNFIRKAADPDSVHDSWLEGLNKKDMKKAKAAQEKRDEERRKQTAADDALLTSDLFSTLITHLHKGESVLEALQRLNAAAPKTKKLPKWKQKKLAAKSDAMDVDADGGAQEDSAEKRRVAAVEAITAAADAIFSRNNPDIYDHERELLQRLYKRETGEDWVDAVVDTPADENAMFEFRWVDARDGGQTHGPYDKSTMRSWREAGYFGQEAEVEFRQVGLDGWSRSADFN